MDVVVVAIFGLAIGSFVNVLIDRLPQGESVLFVRSHCDHCRKTLRWSELVPVLSYIVQNGRCRRCRSRISVQYPLIELLSASLLPILYVRAPDYLAFTASALVAYPLLVISIADLKYSIIPDSMVVVGTIGALLMRLAPTVMLPPSSLLAAMLSGVGAGLFLFSLYALTRGRGMGFGDVKLACFLGLLSGPVGVIVTLAGAFLTGAGVGVILILTKKKTLKSHVPFGPFLIAGLSISLVWGEKIVAWWKGFI